MFTLNFSKFIDDYALCFAPKGTYSAFCQIFDFFLWVIEELPL